MDHPLHAPPEVLVRPWRTAAYVAGTIATVELLILLAIGGGALAGLVSDRVEKAATKRALNAPLPEKKGDVELRPAKVPAKLARGKVRVLVLNGNGRQGAAAAAASDVRRHGYRIGAVANASRTNFRRSIVMFKPGFAGEGRRLGRDLRVRQVTPLDGMRVRELQGAHVVYILGA